MKLIHKKLVNFMNFIFCVFKVLQCIGYNINVIQQSACLVINPVKVDGYAARLNCTPVDRTSDSMMAPT